MSELAQRFARDGFVSPIRIFSAEQAARYETLYARFERDGRIKDDSPGLKIHCVFRWAYEIATHPAVLDVVEDLIGPNILIFGSRPWNKHPSDVRYVAWHQDNSYYGLDPHDEVALWVALTPSNAENGCVKFVPGSHLWGDQVHEIVGNPMNRLTRGQEITTIEEAQAVDAILEPGEASFHHERTVHGSKGNGSTARRLGFQVNYIPTHVRSTIGRRTALLVRGVDEFHHWDSDPIPRFDLDPIGIEANERQTAAYYSNREQVAKEH
ncbi:MAG TPA: phytanoyl-CoA dioxygenase family protein [Candidatus Binatia bacterium]|nr:phytanoyl-CoA dioxygenase family protein [Candidatus Binatia bacterium]